jgi:hypothetical protein
MGPTTFVWTMNEAAFFILLAVSLFADGVSSAQRENWATQQP